MNTIADIIRALSDIGLRLNQEQERKLTSAIAAILDRNQQPTAVTLSQPTVETPPQPTNERNTDPADKSKRGNRRKKAGETGSEGSVSTDDASGGRALDPQEHGES
jgi:hypothetical protein